MREVPPKWKVEKDALVAEEIDDLTCKAIGGEFREGKCYIKLEKAEEEKEE